MRDRRGKSWRPGVDAQHEASTCQHRKQPRPEGGGNGGFCSITFRPLCMCVPPRAHLWLLLQAGECQANGTRQSYHLWGGCAVLPDHSLTLSLSHTLQCDKAGVSVWRVEVCAKGTVENSWVGPREKVYHAAWMLNTLAELEAVQSLLAWTNLRDRSAESLPSPHSSQRANFDYTTEKRRKGRRGLRQIEDLQNISGNVVLALTLWIP